LSITVFPQHWPQSEGQDAQVSVPLQDPSPQAGGATQALVLKEQAAQERSPVYPAPITLAQLAPFKFTPSQSSPASIDPFPQHTPQSWGQLAQVSLPLQEPSGQAGGATQADVTKLQAEHEREPVYPAPNTLEQVAPPKFAPSQSSPASMFSFPQHTPQSWGHDEQVSPPLQLPSPQETGIVQLLVSN